MNLAYRRAHSFIACGELVLFNDNFTHITHWLKCVICPTCYPYDALLEVCNSAQLLIPFTFEPLTCYFRPLNCFIPVVEGVYAIKRLGVG